MKIDLQHIIFSSAPTREDLLLHKQPSTGDKFVVQVFRNHTFEHVERLMGLYLDYAGVSIDFHYSGYDDSFSLASLDPEADAVIMWVDSTRYNVAEFDTFITGRLEAVCSNFQRNIFAACFGSNLDISSIHQRTRNQVTLYEFNRLQRKLGADVVDERLEPFSGTKLSASACQFLAKDLGLNYLPSLLLPNLKCIIVDLDNTLYQGVLGEDGIDGVKVSVGHSELQSELKSLAQKGFFICIVSKNDRQDVVDLFKIRDDFKIGSDDFTIISADWNTKASSIEKIALELNIGLDSVLFIDDNMGELLSVHNSHPDVKLIAAQPDALVTVDILRNFPGIFKLHSSAEDALRKADIQSNQKRNTLKASLSLKDYLISIHTNLIFHCNKADHAARISELSCKTNQFIFSYKRYSSAQVLKLIDDPEFAVVSVTLSDSLSDSGIIGAVFVERLPACGTLQECFVSCRALGRGLDELIVLGAIQVALDHLSKTALNIQFCRGPRNAPAESFVETRVRTFLNSINDFHYSIDNSIATVSINQ